jgi:hypothetical protein
MLYAFWIIGLAGTPAGSMTWLPLLPLVDQRAGALIVSTDPYLFGRRNQIIGGAP